MINLKYSCKKLAYCKSIYWQLQLQKKGTQNKSIKTYSVNVSDAITINLSQ